MKMEQPLTKVLSKFLHVTGVRKLSPNGSRTSWHNGLSIKNIPGSATAASPRTINGKQDGVETLTSPANSVTSYFDFSSVPEQIPSWKARISNSMLIYPDFITATEEKDIMLEIEPYMSRLHYETSHWDDAIHDYRETERKNWNKKNTLVINRIRNLAFPPSVPQLQLVHVLDLAKKGVIKAHIDSIRFCGNTIAGLSILSDSVMRLRHDIKKDHFVDILLPRLSLYVMNDITRYEFTHEILGEKESIFQGRVISRDRRVSIMCRNEPENPPDEGPVFQSSEGLKEEK